MPLVPQPRIRLASGKFTTDDLSQVNSCIHAVELDLARYFSGTPSERKRMRLWVKKNQIRVLPRFRLGQSLEQVAAAKEEFEDQVEFLILAAPKNFVSFPSHIDELLGAEIPIHLEWNESETPATFLKRVQDFPEVGSVLDLDYHQKFIRRTPGPIHFKLHGWHPERWMRRYGPALAQKLVQGLCESLAKRSVKQEDVVLILAHSGRIEEAGVFHECI